MNPDTPGDFVPKIVAFIKQNEDWLHNTVNAVGWTIEDLAASAEAPKPKSICCPLNLEHRMPEQFLETHLMKCEKNNASYPDISNLDLNSSLQGISSLGKLELDHVIPESNRDSTSEKSSSAQTLAELLKAERDAKRRRIAHRGKRVHSNKKSYNEVMREVIANQMLSLNEGVENDEGCHTYSKSDIQEPIVPNPCYLAVGASHHHGNPHKRWLSIEQEEEETIAKIQKPSAKSEEDRNQRYSRHNEDRRSSRRDHRDERDRYYPSFKHDHDYKRDEWRYSESRKENRCRDEDRRRHSRCEGPRRDRREYERNKRDPKRGESTKVVEHSRKRSRKSRENESRDNNDWEVVVKSDRRSEKLEGSGGREKKHKKKKTKKHKHKKKHRSSSSSS